MTTDTPTPLDAFAFLRQLESNARTIASAKRGSARSEWTEDADEFARAIAAAAKLSNDLSECRAALAERQADAERWQLYCAWERGECNPPICWRDYTQEERVYAADEFVTRALATKDKKPQPAAKEGT